MNTNENTADEAINKAIGFNCVINSQVTILVLGSMPGQASLDQQAYYAHPRNMFWPIMQQIFQWPATIDYPKKLVLLNEAGVGLWDVIAECYRKGSLDSAIQTQNLELNNFAVLFKTYPNIKRVLFNGQKAFQLYKQKILKQLDPTLNIEYIVLPSTSPAHASVPFEDKLNKWRDALQR